MHNARVPPQSPEAENEILGAAMIDKKAAIEVIQQLEIKDFYSNDNQAIFEAIILLSNNNKPVDIITVSEKLKDLNRLEDVGGLEQLSDLATNVITTANIKNYISIVKGKSIRRKFIKAGMTIIDSAYDGVYDTISDFKADALKQLDISTGEKASIGIQDITHIVLQNIQERYNSQKIKLPYGIPWIDRKTGGAHDTNLTIIAARPAVGKSSIAMQFGLSFAKKGKHVAIFSLEMSSDQLTERAITNIGLINSDKLKDPTSMTNADNIKLSETINTINNLNLHIFDDVFKIELIRARCMELKLNNQLDAVFIDYLQLCGTVEKTKGLNERVSAISRQSKMMAKELRVPVIMLSQLNRANEQDNRPPKLMDLRDSGAIEQDADDVFFLHDPEKGKETIEERLVCDTQFIIAKQRNGTSDIRTDVKFYKGTQRWEG